MSRQTEQNSIRLDALDLQVGETLPNKTCPFCKADHEKSLSVTRTDEGLLYNCYRVSCKARGFIPSGTLRQEKVTRQFLPRQYRYPTQELSSSQFDFFRRKFDLTEEEVVNNGFKYSPEKDSFVFPILDIRGYEVGVVDRSYKGRIPKTIAYWFNDVPKIHFPVQDIRGDDICLVEDTISAIRVARHRPCAALLGTALTERAVKTLSGVYQGVTLLLDPDAVKTAIKLKNRYALDFRNFTIIPLSKRDPKDMSDQELREVFVCTI